LATGQYSIGLVLLAYRVFGEKGQERFGRLTLYVALAVGFLLGLISGMLETAFLPVLLVFIVRWQVTRRLPLLWAVGSALMIVVLTGVKSEYRQAAWWGGESLSVTERVLLWFDLSRQYVEDAGQDTGDSQSDSALSKTVHRLDLLHVLAYVMERTPDMVPYYGGTSYTYALTGWIPRFLWPNKPTAQEQNNAMVADYKLLDPRIDQTTSIGIGQVAEAYANLGVTGILVVMAVLGIVLGVIDRVFNGPGSEGGRAVYVVAVTPFLNGIGSAAAPMLTGVVLTIVGSTFIVRFFATDRQSRSRTRWNPGMPVRDRVSP
jgi:hypothetical protein